MRKPRSRRARPNRIFDLTKERGWTYADVAARVAELARDRGDTKHSKVHAITINRLATGEAQLTHDWMKLLGEVYAVPAVELISVPIAENLRRVRVVCALEAKVWRPTTDLPNEEQFDIMIPNDEELRAVALYAGEIRGPSNNLRYSHKSVAVLSKLEQKPGEIVEGKRYHVRAMRTDGMIEDSIKLLTRGPEGQYWLKPESDHPSHQEWLPLAGRDDLRVEIIGRVRGVFFRED